MDMCTAYGLNQVDLLTPAERKLSEKEYWAKRRGQKKLDKHNAELEKKGLTPRQTTFQTEKQYLRDAIDTVASQAISQEDFSRLLSEKYNITFKVSRGRYSYLHPNRSKYITGRNSSDTCLNEILDPSVIPEVYASTIQFWNCSIILF